MEYILQTNSLTKKYKNFQALKNKIDSDQKMKKKDSDLSIPLSRTQDILKYLGEHKSDNQLLIGFSMETENLIVNSREKLTKKNADMICANSICGNETGFE